MPTTTKGGALSEVTHVWRLVEQWRKKQRFHVSQSALARDIGVARTAVSQWKLGQSTPSPEHLRAIQSATGIRYRDLLDALLQDMGYLAPDAEEMMGNAKHPAAIDAEVTKGETVTPPGIRQAARQSRGSDRASGRSER